MSNASSASLADLNPGTSAIIEGLEFSEMDAQQLMDLGLIPGATISCLKHVPLGDLTVYQVEGSQIALRRETTVSIRIQLRAATTLNGK